MTTDQIILFTILTAVFAALIWGKVRYDLVAFAALLISVLVGLVPASETFSGFGHPAVVVIALVLVVSKGLSNAGAVELVARSLTSAGRSLSSHIAAMAGLSAALSAVMNNVGALALLMPVDIKAAQKAKRSPGLSLMALSFASILGGLITLIGTPPNIIIAAYREKVAGEPFQMFDFAPVGLACAVVGVIYVATIGWRLIPFERSKHDAGSELFDLGEYVAEVEVPEGSPAIGQKVRDLDKIADDNGIAVLGLVRRGRRLPGFARAEEIRASDLIVIEAGADAIDAFVGALKLTYSGQKSHASSDTAAATARGGDLELIEVVVPEDARITGRRADDVRLRHRFGITLLGVSRQGRPFRDRVRRLEIKAGDVLLLIGPPQQLQEVTTWLGCLPLAERGLEVLRRSKATLAAGLFGLAILASSLGLLYLPVALALVVIAYVAAGIVPGRQLYDTIEWPVIVLLASMIPIGIAMETTGGTALIAGSIINITEGAAPWVVLTILMVITMTLSDVMNNTATAVISAPIAVEIASRLGVSSDPFLMAVAVAASCAFLTPIGHKNNTLIMGPGGYRFGDYWRMGLPLEIIVIAVAVPMILWAWPF